MKAIDASEYTLIKAGKEYQPASRAEAEAKHGNKPASACSKKLVQLLHGGEAYVWWLQPRDGGLSEQVACVKVHGVLYRLNQKLEKVAFRHIRLTKHFKNVEVLSDGTQKLCIPTRLLQHKLRTSQRFMKQARDKPSARAAKRKKSSGSSGHEAPKETYWRRCLGLVMAGRGGKNSNAAPEETTERVTSLRADADVMAKSMQVAYTAAFGSSKRRRLPTWMLGGGEEGGGEEKSVQVVAELAEDKADKQDSMDEKVDAEEDEEDEKSLECGFCGKQGRGHGTRVYDADTFDAQMLCRHCAQSYRKDWLDDGMEYPPMLCRQ